MKVPLWVSALASTFWARARLTEPFPRNLQRPIARAVPLAIVLLPKLSVRVVLDRLWSYGLPCELSGNDRSLRACLVARYGHGVAFLDGSTDEAEQRLSMAHELAHFLRDYWIVRQRTLNRLGPAVRRVLDGEEAATSSELLHALLRNVPLGVHVHLMERDEYGEPGTPAIAQAEKDADRLAYELLAPVEHVARNGRLSSKSELENRLQDFYGLPALHASRYAGILVPTTKPDPLLLRFQSPELQPVE